MSLAAGIWVKALSGSDSLAAFTGFCVWFPTLTGPLIGAVADRFPRRRLLVGTNLALAAALTTPLVLHSSRQIWLLFAVLILVGTGAVLTESAETALMTSAVPDELRGDLNGLVRTAVESMKLLAPLAGAGLFSALGGSAVALLDSITFLFAAAAFVCVRVRRREPAPKLRQNGSWRKDAVAGGRFLWRQRLLRKLVVAGGTAMAASSLSSTATFALLDTGLHRPPTFAGALLWAQGLGSVLIGIAAGAFLRRIPERVFAAAGLSVFAIGILARTTPWLPVVLIGHVAIGLGLPCPLVASVTALQRQTPNELLGRVTATANTLMFAPTGLALLLGTGMVALLDYRVQLCVAGVLALAATVFLARMSCPDFRRVRDRVIKRSVGLAPVSPSTPVRTRRVAGSRGRSGVVHRCTTRPTGRRPARLRRSPATGPDARSVRP
ncbi:MFS transporter [Streptantibioticus cattleyicolor]|nr:MFS transporter [Streptantibioticus cattleyicolor]